MERQNTPHFPVMIREIIENMNLFKDGVYADLTFGAGGHSGAILEKGVQRLDCVDRDKRAIEAAPADPNGGRRLIHAPFSQFIRESTDQYDGILIDLGVSTQQILDSSRGFSFQAPGPLDMRMDEERDLPLVELMKGMRERELATILERNTDMKGAHKVARKLVDAYRAGHLKDSGDLVKLFSGGGKRHSATVIFLALRMWVNQELEEIEEALPACVEHLKPKGRLCVISFHSTEDRVVKHLFRRFKEEGLVAWVYPKPLVPTRQEMRINPRSRSAKLRVIERL